MLAHAVEADPVAVNLIGLAALETELGDTDSAAIHVQQAVALGYGEPAVALNAGLVAERLGDPATALDQFADAIVWDPPLASSSIWTSPPRIVAKDDIIDGARARTNPFDSALILAYTGATDAARSELEAMPRTPTRDAYLATVVGLGGDISTSFGMFNALLAKNASDWFAAAMAARIDSRAGGSTDNTYARWAIAVQGDAAPAVINEVFAVPAASDAWDAGLSGTYPWAVYLRPTVPYLLVPELTLIGHR
jgi:hypothetical protein